MRVKMKTKRLSLICITALLVVSALLTGCGSVPGLNSGSTSILKNDASGRSAENTEAAKALPDTIRWFNASYAVLTAINGNDYNMFGGMKPNKINESMQQVSLEEWWGVTDRETADETLDWILTEGHRTDYVELVKYLDELELNTIPAEERAATLVYMFEDVTEDEAAAMANYYSWYEELGETAIDGWDYCRALNLLSFYYIAGYYTEEEALDKSLEIAQDLQPKFGSWDELIDSYMRGYEFWNETDSTERQEVYKNLLAAEDNPYSVDYNITLQKEW